MVQTCWVQEEQWNWKSKPTNITTLSIIKNRLCNKQGGEIGGNREIKKYQKQSDRPKQERRPADQEPPSGDPPELAKQKSVNEHDQPNKDKAIEINESENFNDTKEGEIDMPNNSEPKPKKRLKSMLWW